MKTPWVPSRVSKLSLLTRATMSDDRYYQITAPAPFFFMQVVNPHQQMLNAIADDDVQRS